LKKKDFLWVLGLGVFFAFVLLPATHGIFITFTMLHPFISGFIKFAYLATMGELLAIRIVLGKWSKPDALQYRSIIWGFLGMVITLIFQIYGVGVAGALSKGYLPGGTSSFAFAFFTSALMNTTFAPTFMAFHRCTDTYLDLKYTKKVSKPSIKNVVEEIDWSGFIKFVLFKTVPLFWIPAHTITFLLPSEYRILVAASLSIALGAILSFGKRK
jgi:hypothetical protein